MLVTDLDSLLEYVKTAPICDGNHVWVHDEEDDEGEFHCAGCFVIKDEEIEE